MQLRKGLVVLVALLLGGCTIPTGQPTTPEGEVIAPLAANTPLSAYPAPSTKNPVLLAPPPPSPTLRGYPVPDYSLTPLPTMDPLAGLDIVPQAASDPWHLEVWEEPRPNPVPLEQVTSQATLIVLGEIVEVGPARWTTPDGKRPANPHLSGDHGDVAQYFIYTPVRVKVAQTLKGLPRPEVIVRFPGGQVGEDQATYHPQEFYTAHIGETMLLFLAEDEILMDEAVLWRMHERYTIMPDNQAINVYGVGSTQTLLSRIEQLTQTTTENE